MMTQLALGSWTIATLLASGIAVSPDKATPAIGEAPIELEHSRTAEPPGSTALIGCPPDQWLCGGSCAPLNWNECFGTCYPPQYPDINVDGVVNACDVLLWAHDQGLYQSQSVYTARSDFNGDCRIDLIDQTTIISQVCSSLPNPPPPPTALPGTATIGVYFDAAGTISTRLNVAPFALVDFYVVARGVTSDIRRFTFGLNLPDGLMFSSFNGPPGAASLSPIDGIWVVEFVDDPGQCLTGDTVQLAHFTAWYFGGVDLAVGLANPSNSCHVPADHPAYAPCDSPVGACEWTYFAAPHGIALVNPADFNGNGIADIYEVDESTRLYQITGTSDGIGWSMGVRGPGGALFNHEVTNNEALPLGATEADFAAAFIAGLGSLASSVEVGPWFGAGSFYIRVPGGQGFELGVGPYGSSPDCWMPPGTACTFNPSIQDITAPTAAGPLSPRSSGNLANYPNPFNPRTVIAFDLGERTTVNLRIYDIAGRAVRTLLDGQLLEAGRREVGWDGCDDSGHPMAAGVYHYRLDAGGLSESRRMVLLK